MVKKADSSRTLCCLSFTTGATYQRAEFKCDGTQAEAINNQIKNPFFHNALSAGEPIVNFYTHLSSIFSIRFLNVS